MVDPGIRAMGTKQVLRVHLGSETSDWEVKRRIWEVNVEEYSFGIIQEASVNSCPSYCSVAYPYRTSAGAVVHGIAMKTVRNETTTDKRKMIRVYFGTPRSGWCFLYLVKR
jgi:hypothetical protein